MTFLFPGFLIAAGIVSAGVVILHLLVTQQPRSEDLPTVRFVPDVPARSTSVAIKPSDLLLLLVRVLTIMAIGAAFAQPMLSPSHQTTANIVVADMSRSVNNLGEVADSARAYLDDAAAVVVFDSVAHDIDLKVAGDSLTALASAPRSGLQGSLSSAMITAMRAASRVREGADSLRLVVISPFVNEAVDAATDSLRALWPGHIQMVRVAAAVNDSAAARTPAEPAIEWAETANGGTFWQARQTPDTMGALRAGDAVLVYPFLRKWEAAIAPDSVTHVYARWADGQPAAFERTNSDGSCVRSLAASMPTEGDATLRPDFVRFLTQLSEPCGAQRVVTLAPQEFMEGFAGPAALAPVDKIASRELRMTPLVPWLLAAAIVLALIELLVRRISGMGSGSAGAAVANATKAGKSKEKTEVAA